jgi:hypothetical protein
MGLRRVAGSVCAAHHSCACRDAVTQGEPQPGEAYQRCLSIFEEPLPAPACFVLATQNHPS